MKYSLFVVFVLFGAVTLQAFDDDISVRQKRQRKFDDDNGYEEDETAIRYPNQGRKWGKKPGGWQKPTKPCRRPPCSFTKPTTLPPNDEPVTEPFQPTVTSNTKPTTWRDTRPTFPTSAEPPLTKPTSKPPVPTKPSKPPTGGGSVVFPDSGEDWRPTRTPRPSPTPQPTPKPTQIPNPKPTKKPDGGLTPNKDPTVTPVIINECMSKCYMTAEDEPVCGNNGVTYINKGHFECAKKCGVAVNTISRGSCKGDDDNKIKKCLTQCPVSTEYNPVCGTNNQNYLNYGLLVCAKSCGVVVEFQYQGLCRNDTTTKSPPTPTTTEEPDSSTPLSDEKRQCISQCPVTSEYNPVCGTNSFTYTNPGRLLCAKECGVDVDLLSRGPCRSTSSSTSPPIIRSTTASFLQQACLARCPASIDYNPVCGTDNVTYYNYAALYCAQYCGSKVQMLKSGECDKNSNLPTTSTTEATTLSTTPPATTVATTESVATTQSSVVRECIKKCLVTPEYNPVCGTDYQTYNNPGLLYCAQDCGVDVQLLRHGPCPRNTFAPPPTPTPTTAMTTVTSTTQSSDMKKCIEGCIATPEYNPVCGTNQETYSNLGRLYCAQYCGIDVKLLRHGPCPKRTAAAAITNIAASPTMKR